MKKLKLYPSLPQAAVGRETPIPIDHECQRCDFHKKPGLRTRCMNPEGTPGGVLIVGESPGAVEDQQHVPFAGGTGKQTRQLVKRFWRGPIAYDNAIKCMPAGEVKDKHVNACRPYLSHVVRDVAPQRIVCMGNAAVQGIMGRRVPVFSLRRGFGWYFDDDGGAIPIYFLSHPAWAMRNRFTAQAFEKDLEWALTSNIPATRFDGLTQLVETGSDAHAVHDLIRGTVIAYDVETSGRMGNPSARTEQALLAQQVIAHVKGHVFGIESVTLLSRGDKASYTWTREALNDKHALGYLKEILENSKLITQNGKYDDRSVLSFAGIDIREPFGDTRLMRKLLDFESPASLDVLAELVGMGGHKEEAQEKISEICKELRYQANPPSGLTPTGKQRKVRPPAFKIDRFHLDAVRQGEEAMAFAFHYLDDTTLYRYNARDVHSTMHVYDVLATQMTKEPNISRVWDNIVKDANKAVRWIEYWGIACDKGSMQTTAQYCKAKIVEAQVKLKKYGNVNSRSPKQLQEFLFKTLRLKPSKLTSSQQFSTDRETLEELRSQHPAVQYIIDDRVYTKLDGTYATGMQLHIREDGRIHATYLLDGAGTGRLSSADPNMQNLPRADSAEGKMIRDCFIAPKDYVLIEADQSQIELRVAAMLSGDKNMIADYRAGIDIHSNNARECCEVVWGIKRADWDKMDKKAQGPYRSQIKTTTFGKLYGKTDAGLAAEFGVDKKQIEAINKKIWGRYSQLARWIQECVAYSRRTGVTWTWWDGQDARRRQVWKIADRDEKMAAHAERTAYNTRIQGTAADFTTSSLWPIVDYFLAEGLPAKVVATVHDSIVVECHKDCIAEATGHMKKVMTGWPSKDVPLVAEFKVGERWGSMEELKVP